MARTARKTRVSSAATSLFGLIACSFRHLTLRDRLCHANPCGTRLAVPLCLSRMHLLTSSSIRAFRLCGMKYKLSYLDLIEPVKSTSALIFGTNVHLMLEAYWRARKARAKDPLAAAMAAMPKMEKFEEVRAKVMMLCYALIWNPILCEVIDVEIAFDLPLVHPVTGEVHPFFRRAGKIDLMLRLYNKDGSSRIALVEHKTTSDTAEEGGDYMRRLTLDEQLSVITGLWRTPDGGTFSHDGPVWPVSGSPALPKPVQAGGPPVIIGGFGPRRTPALVARHAAEFNAPFCDLATTTGLQANIDSACESIGRDPSTVLRSAAQVVCCGSDDGEIARRAAAIGREPAELAENGMGGTPEQLVDKLGRFAAAGIPRVYLQMLDIDDLDHLELLAAEVLPAVRSLA